MYDALTPGLKSVTSVRLPRRAVSVTRMAGVVLLMAGVLAIRLW